MLQRTKKSFLINLHKHGVMMFNKSLVVYCDIIHMWRIQAAFTGYFMDDGHQAGYAYTEVSSQPNRRYAQPLESVGVAYTRILTRRIQRDTQDGNVQMLYLSEVLMQNPQVDTFERLLQVVQERSRSEMFFRIDVKPQFQDTPENWEDRLEAAFT